MDLTNFYENGLVLDKELHFGSGKDISDAINQMNDDGLAISFIDTSGDVIRCMVKASANTRPDKSNEKSGWYVYNENGNYINIVYGNWRNGTTFKWSNTDTNKLSLQERNKLKTDIAHNIERSKKERAKRHDEVAKDCEERFKSAKECVHHKYLENKKIKNYGLKTIRDSLVVPLYSTNSVKDQKLRSLQYISAKGDKRFVSASEVKGSVFILGFSWSEWQDLEKVIVVEGISTMFSIYEATKIPCVCTFSANFGLTALKSLRKFTKAQFIICYDNDANNVGNMKSEEIASALNNCLVRLPSIIGDYNDLHQQQGLDAVRNEILDSGLPLKQFNIKFLKGEIPKREWLVENFIELGKPGIMASIGGIGKSMLALDLCLKVAHGSGSWLGNQIVNSGSAVYLSAEDDAQELHRRVDSLDKEGKRFEGLNEVYALPIPSMKERLIVLGDNSSSGLHLTSQAEELITALESIENLKLVVIDPVQSFVSASISSSNEAGQMYASFCANISARLGATTLSIHHMSKAGLVSTEDNMTARASIRGASSLVDAHRFALALYLSSEEEAERLCLQNGVEFDRTRVVRASMVKSNSEIDYSVKTLFRKDVVLETIEDQKGVINWD